MMHVAAGEDQITESKRSAAAGLTIVSSCRLRGKRPGGLFDRTQLIGFRMIYIYNYIHRNHRID